MSQPLHRTERVGLHLGYRVRVRESTSAPTEGHQGSQSPPLLACQPADRPVCLSLHRLVYR